MTLIQAGLYGDPSESLALNLRRAFRDFEMWRKTNKVLCSQVPWTTGLVARLLFILFSCHGAFTSVCVCVCMWVGIFTCEFARGEVEKTQFIN